MRLAAEYLKSLHHVANVVFRGFLLAPEFVPRELFSLSADEGEPDPEEG